MDKEKQLEQFKAFLKEVKGKVKWIMIKTNIPYINPFGGIDKNNFEIGYEEDYGWYIHDAFDYEESGLNKRNIVSWFKYLIKATDVKIEIGE